VTKLRLCGSREFIKALLKDGFSEKKRRSRGSHIDFVKPKRGGGRPWMVTVQRNQKEFKPKHLRRMIKQAGWSRDKYHRLLDDP